MYNRRNKNFLRLVTFAMALFLSSTAMAAGGAAGGSPPYHYLVKLRGADRSALDFIAANIRHQFSFSPDPRFQNIYSFDSSFGLAGVRARLSGVADYVEPDQAFWSSAAYGSYSDVPLT